MIIKKPFKNADIPADFYQQLSKIPQSYRELHEMSIQHNDCLVLDYPFRILISLNDETLVNVYESGLIIIHNFTIILLSQPGTITITL